MYIKSQDGNVIFTLSDKGLFKGTVFTRDIYIKGKYYGSNIYGRRLFKKYFLGTFEEGEGEQVINEIYALLKAGAKFYSMPEAYLEPEDMGVIL